MYRPGVTADVSRFVWTDFPVKRESAYTKTLKGGPGSGRYPKGSGGDEPTYAGPHIGFVGPDGKDYVDRSGAKDHTELARDFLKNQNAGINQALLAGYVRYWIRNGEISMNFAAGIPRAGANARQLLHDYHKPGDNIYMDVVGADEVGHFFDNVREANSAILAAEKMPVSGWLSRVGVQKGGPGSGRYPKGSGAANIPAHLGLAMIEAGADLKDAPAGAFGHAKSTSAEDMKKEPLPTTLKQAEDRIRDEENEHAFIIQDGVPVMILGSDQKDGVALEGGYARAPVKLGNAVLTHNHPLDMGLSIDDGQVASGNHMREIRAVVSDGTWSLKRVEFDWPADIGRLMRQHQDEVTEEFKKRMATGELSVWQARLSHYPEVWGRVVRDLNNKAGRNVILHTFEPKS